VIVCSASTRQCDDNEERVPAIEVQPSSSELKVHNLKVWICRWRSSPVAEQRRHRRLPLATESHAQRPFRQR
jgi:hypothetical protein